MQTVLYGNYKYISDFKEETINEAKTELWKWFDKVSKEKDGVIYGFEWDIETEVCPNELANEEGMAVTLKFKRDEV
jgi:hypothetical protein